MSENRKEPYSSTDTGLESLREKLIKLSETPPAQARSAVGELKVVKIASIPELWVVIGRESDYLVIRKTYCNCPHFTIRVIGGESSTPCYHLIAIEMAIRQGRFHDLSLSLSKDELIDIVLEILAGTRSTTLRKRLYMLT